MDHMVDQSDSYVSVAHTKRDLHNRLESVRRTSQDFDADAIIDDTLGNLFWTDSMSRNDYLYFGDVLSFNSTYRTNAYRRLLVIFVGVNHNNKTIVFDFRLLVDKTIETYSWILKTFLLVMYGKCPIFSCH
ncbi:hypothetical protein ACOSQ2_010192 [Xanthoceras sorbifolium]